MAPRYLRAFFPCKTADSEASRPVRRPFWLRSALL